MAQVVRSSPPTAGVPSSRLGSSIWVSWWTKRGLGRFLSGFLPFSPTTNFIPPFLHTDLIHFVSFHQPLWWCVRRGRPAPLLFTDLQYRGFIASHPSTQPFVGHELRIFIYILFILLQKAAKAKRSTCKIILKSNAVSFAALDFQNRNGILYHVEGHIFHYTDLYLIKIGFFFCI